MERAVDVATVKAATLKVASFRGARLPAVLAVRLISALPWISVDLSAGGVSPDSEPIQLKVDPGALVREINLRGSSFVSMLWWGDFPRKIVRIDFTGVVAAVSASAPAPAKKSLLGGIGQMFTSAPAPLPTRVISVFDELGRIFSSLREPIALRDLSVAEVRPALPDNSDFLRFLNALLLNAMIKLVSLDITGCGSGDRGLQCLGACLRTNRSLTTLKMDGQMATLVGWQALRGCLFGNKKLISVSYPFHDCSQYFSYVANQVAAGWREAAQIKAAIGAAHRSNRWRLKQEKIAEIKACKGKFRALERSRFKAVYTLQALFAAVEQNAATMVSAAAVKNQAQLAKPYLVQTQDRIVSKQGLLLSKLQGQLNEMRHTQQSGAFSAGRSAASLPAVYAPYAQLASSAQFVPVAVATPVVPAVVDQAASTWADIESTLSLGPMLFVPETFYQLCALVELVGGRGNAKVAKTLCEMEAFIRSTQTKAAQWGHSPHNFATYLATSRPTAFGAFANFRFAPPQSFEDRELQRQQEQQRRVHERRMEAERRQRERLLEREQMQRRRNDDDYDGDGDVDARNARNQEDHHDNTDTAVGMYAGAGPRDLPDGGNGGGAGGCNPPNRVPWPNQSTAGSSDLPEESAADILRKSLQQSRAAKAAVDDAQRLWVTALGREIDHCVEEIAPVVDFKTAPRFLRTRRGSAANAACCLVTQCSVDRLSKLEAQCRRWDGLLSAAVYISTASLSETRQALQAVRELVARLDGDEGSFNGLLVVSILFGHEDSPWLWDDCLPGSAEGPLYPINALRNLAVAAVGPDAATLSSPSDPAASIPSPQLIFLLDVDFLPSPGLNDWMQQHACKELDDVAGDDIRDGLLARCERGEVLVVPAFERDANDNGCPREATLSDVCDGYSAGAVTPFHVKHFPAGHNPTDYERWVQGLPFYLLSYNVCDYHLGGFNSLAPKNAARKGAGRDLWANLSPMRFAMPSTTSPT